MKQFLIVCALVLAAGALRAQTQEDVLGIHTGPGTPGRSKRPLPACQFCHAPHSGLNSSSLPNLPLWSQTLSTHRITRLHQPDRGKTRAQTHAGLGQQSLPESVMTARWRRERMYLTPDFK